MSLFSRLFGESKKHLTKKRFEEITEQTRKQMQPVDEISLVIVKAAVAVRDTLKHLAKGDTQDEDSRLATEMAVFYQSIYFMRALTIQAACRCLESSQFDRFVCARP